MPIASEKLKISILGDAKDAKAAFAEASAAAKKSMHNIAASTIKATAAFSAAATVAAATFAIGKIRVFEKSISDLSAITGATGKDLEFMKRKALEFGASTTLSASQAAEAFKLIASAKPDLLDNAAALAKVTRETITLSEAAGIALPEAANALGSSLNQFNADAAESGRFINVLAAGAKFGASEIAQTAEALKMAGTVAFSAGLSFEQTNAAIQALASVAIKGSEAGTGLRGVLLKLSTQSRDEFNPEIVGFTTAIQNLEKAHLSTTEKTKLFGLESITAANALIKEAGDLDTLTGKLTDTNTAYDQASIRVNNLDGDVKKLMSAVEGAGLSFQKDLNPELRSMVQLLTESVNGFATFISVMSGAKTQLALAVKLQDLREQLKGAEDDFRSLAKNGAVSFSMLGEGMLGGVDGRMSKLGQTIEKLKKSIKDTQLERQVKIMENAGANIDAYFQAVDAGSSKAEASLIAFAQAKADAFVDTTAGNVGDQAAFKQVVEAGGSVVEARIIAIAQAKADVIQIADLAEQAKTTALAASNKGNPVSGSAPSGAPSGSSSPPVNQALTDAQKIIDIHSQKFQRIQILGQASFADEQTMLLAKQDADIASLDTERQRFIDATALQIEDATARKDATANINDYYDQQTIDRAQQTANQIGLIDANIARKKTVAQTDSYKFAMAVQNLEISGILGGAAKMTAGLAQHNKAAFKANQIFAKGQVVVDGIVAVQKAASAFPFPANVPGVLFETLSAAGRYAAVSSASFGGGGSIPSSQGGSAGGVPSAQMASVSAFNPVIQRPTTPISAQQTTTPSIQITQHITAPNAQIGAAQAIQTAANLGAQQALAAVGQDFANNGALRQQLAV